MNIAQLTLDREKSKKDAEIKQKIDFENAQELAFKAKNESLWLERNPPITDVKSFFVDPELNHEEPESSVDTAPNYGQLESSVDPRQQNTKLESLQINGVIDLSNLFRQNKNDLSIEQQLAFSGLESLRDFIESQNCNCVQKKAKLEQYYRDFVVGNSESDLFTTLKSKTNFEKIIFFYENQEIHQI